MSKNLSHSFCFLKISLLRSVSSVYQTKLSPHFSITYLSPFVQQSFVNTVANSSRPNPSYVTRFSSSLYFLSLLVPECPVPLPFYPILYGPYAMTVVSFRHRLGLNLVLVHNRIPASMKFRLNLRRSYFFLSLRESSETLIM